MLMAGKNYECRFYKIKNPLEKAENVHNVYNRITAA